MTTSDIPNREPNEAEDLTRDAGAEGAAEAGAER